MSGDPQPPLESAELVPQQERQLAAQEQQISVGSMLQAALKGGVTKDNQCRDGNRFAAEPKLEWNCQVSLILWKAGIQYTDAIGEQLRELRDSEVTAEEATRIANGTHPRDVLLFPECGWRLAVVPDPLLREAM